MSPAASSPRPSRRASAAPGPGGDREVRSADGDAARAGQDAGLGRTHGQLARGRRLGALVLAIETLGLLGAATYAAVDIRGTEGLPPSYGTAMAGFLVVFALLLGLAALSLIRGGRFGVGYGLTWQLFQALVGATMLRGGLVLPGLFAILTAVAAFVLLANLARYTPTPLEEDPQLDPGPRSSAGPRSSSRRR